MLNIAFFGLLASQSPLWRENRYIQTETALATYIAASAEICKPLTFQVGSKLNKQVYVAVFCLVEIHSYAAGFDAIDKLLLADTHQVHTHRARHQPHTRIASTCHKLR